MLCCKHVISEAAYYKWKAKSGADYSDAQRLQELKQQLRYEARRQFDDEMLTTE
ncbi:hypothetical protein [Cupriavidus plantarum]|uniref:hypothetical protein n=1 Tax=Cupriavidus plantarum TaxID=942865 RepID=UPI0015C8F18E|nr:hypothetical protein [Cupriavidus plantarum]NYH97484.1 hypothetical protein [Cupriavidus plantarum]